MGCNGENSSSNPEVETWISQTQHVHTISPWLCKKGNNWVVWILNSHVHDISTTLIPSSSTERVIHYGDLIWDTCQTQLGWGNVEELSWDRGSSLEKFLNVDLELALAAIQKCLTLLHDKSMNQLYLNFNMISGKM